MSVSFGASSSSMVTLPRCQTEDQGYDVRINETLLISGELSIQTSTVYGHTPVFTCVGLSSERDAVLGTVGVVGTLVINGSSYTNMYLKSFGPSKMNTMSSYYTFQVSFVRGSS